MVKFEIRIARQLKDDESGWRRVQLYNVSSKKLLAEISVQGTYDEVKAAAPKLLQARLRDIMDRASEAVGELDGLIREKGGTTTPPENMAARLYPVMNGSYVENGMINDADREAETIVKRYGLGVLVEALKTIVTEHPDWHTMECALHMLSCINADDPAILEVANLCKDSHELEVQEQLISLFDGNYVEGGIELLNAMSITEAWVNSYRTEVLRDYEKHGRMSNGN